MVTNDAFPAVGKAMKHLDLDGHDLPPSPAPSTPTNGRKYALATELVFTEGSDQHNASSMTQGQSKALACGPLTAVSSQIDTLRSRELFAFHGYWQYQYFRENDAVQLHDLCRGP